MLRQQCTRAPKSCQCDGVGTLFSLLWKHCIVVAKNLTILSAVNSVHFTLNFVYNALFQWSGTLCIVVEDRHMPHDGAAAYYHPITSPIIEKPPTTDLIQLFNQTQ